jgi:hypothetical protein
MFIAGTKREIISASASASKPKTPNKSSQDADFPVACESAAQSKAHILQVFPEARHLSDVTCGYAVLVS